jgi:DNA invertase Pin-like site-specific DNA recombinase
VSSLLVTKKASTRAAARLGARHNRAAVDQLERYLIRERVSAGVRNARALGKELGHPRQIVDHGRPISD